MGWVQSADGVPIAYRVIGEGRPALVFVHGWCCDQGYWEAQLPCFVERHTVVTLDLAGHGESGLQRKTLTMAAFGQDVEAVVRELDLDQVVLVGHSMGGHVIVEAARQMPGRVIGLVGVDCFGDVEVRATRAEFDERLAAWRADSAQATRDLVRSMFGPAADPALVEWVAEDMSAASPEVALSAAEEAQLKHDLARAFEEVAAPICCIASGTATTNVEAARRHAPSFEVLPVPEVGHFVMMEDPKAFNRLLATVVQGFASSGPGLAATSPGIGP